MGRIFGRGRNGHRREQFTTTIEGRKRFPVQVRIQRDERDDIEKLGEILVATPSGKQIPLAQVAKIKRVVGPSEIASENGRLRVFVQANVTDRDLGGFVNELKSRIEKEIKLPAGMTIEWKVARRLIATI